MTTGYDVILKLIEMLLAEKEENFQLRQENPKEKD